MEAEKLIHTLHETPPQADAEGLCDTHCDMEAVALVDTLAETPLQGNAEAFSEKLGSLKVKKSTRTLTTYNQRRAKQTSTNYTI